MTLPLRFYLHRGQIDATRCHAEVARERDFAQCGAKPVDDELGAPLCGRHKKWIGVRLGRQQQADSGV